MSMDIPDTSFAVGYPPNIIFACLLTSSQVLEAPELHSVGAGQSRLIRPFYRHLDVRQLFFSPSTQERRLLSDTSGIS